MEKLKALFLSRADELTTWVGVIGFPLELVLHRDPSTLMLCMFAALVFLPDAQFSTMFAGWKKTIQDLE